MLGERSLAGGGPHRVGAGLPRTVISGPTRCYELLDEPSGRPGIRLALQHGELGFARRVAIRTIRSDQVEVVHALVAGEAELRHPNIVPTLDIVVDGRAVHAVMEHVEGPTLAGVIGGIVNAGRHLPAKIAAAIVHDVLLALAHVSSSRDDGFRSSMINLTGVDVSPAKMILGADGMTRLFDVGIPAPRPPGEDLGYLAPEMAEGAPMTPAANVYACGAILWELLVGQRMPEGEVGGVAPTIDKPSRRVRGISPEVDAVVMCALSYDPRRRFSNVLEMAIALSAAAGIATRREVIDAVAALRSGGPLAYDEPRPSGGGSRTFATRVLVALSALLVIALAVVVGRPHGKRSSPKAAPAPATAAANASAPPPSAPSPSSPPSSSEPAPADGSPASSAVALATGPGTKGRAGAKSGNGRPHH